MNTEQHNPILSVAVTYHNERFLAHTNILAIDDARRFLEAHGHRVQLVLTLSNAKPETEAIVRNHPRFRAGDKIALSPSGDLSDARNAGIAAADGKYVSLFDGDDYMAEDYLLHVLAAAAVSDRCVAYPKYRVNFGASDSLDVLPELGDGFTLYSFVEANPLVSMVTTLRSNFVRVPYVPKGKSFMTEDWHWMCQAIAAGLTPVAADSFYFYRRAENSMLMREAARGNLIIRPNALYDFLSDFPCGAKEIQSGWKSNACRSSLDYLEEDEVPCSPGDIADASLPPFPDKKRSETVEREQPEPTPRDNAFAAPAQPGFSPSDQPSPKVGAYLPRLRSTYISFLQCLPQTLGYPLYLLAFSAVVGAREGAGRGRSCYHRDVVSPRLERKKNKRRDVASAASFQWRDEEEASPQPVVEPSGEKGRRFPGAKSLAAMSDRELMEEALRRKTSIAQLDSLLHPTYARGFTIHRPRHDDTLGTLFAQLLHNARKARPEVVYVLPDYHLGGVTSVALRFCDVLAKHGVRTLCLATIPGSEASEFLQRRHGVPMLSLPSEAGRFNAGQRRILLTKLLLQLAPKAVHAINSNDGYDAITAFSGALREYTRLYASFFCDDKLHDGTPVGYVSMCLRDVFPHVDGVSTDCDAMALDWQNRFGISENAVTPIYNHVGDCEPPPTVVQPARRNRVLWFSRVCPQKRPDVLIDIAAKMPDIIFDVFGNCTADNEQYLRAMAAAPNIDYRGPVHRLDQIDYGKYFAFLYTSEYDGLPNVLLEMTTKGLPIVAANAGGVSDFITADTGWLVEDSESVSTYARMLKEVQLQPDLARRKWHNAMALIRSRHSPSAVWKALRSFYSLDASRP